MLHEFKNWICTKGGGKNTFVISVKDEPFEDNIAVINSSRIDAELNGKLIAAAPELLENLIRVVDRMEENGLGHMSAVARAKEAIKRATE